MIQVLLIPLHVAWESVHWNFEGGGQISQRCRFHQDEIQTFDENSTLLIAINKMRNWHLSSFSGINISGQCHWNQNARPNLQQNPFKGTQIPLAYISYNTLPIFLVRWLYISLISGTSTPWAKLVRIYFQISATILGQFIKCQQIRFFYSMHFYLYAVIYFKTAMDIQ